MNNDNLANVLSSLDNAERISKTHTISKQSSTVITRVLDVLKSEGYIEGYTVEADGRGNAVHIQLTQSINRVGAIKPRFTVKGDGFVKFEKRYLPAQGFGVLIVSTPKGIMTHTQAKEIGSGGTLLAYCY
jgi:small subunit ribosomal protein S8